MHFVLDGAPLPAKAGTHDKRAAKRADSALEAKRLASEGARVNAYQKACSGAMKREEWFEIALCEGLTEDDRVSAERALFETDAQLGSCLRLTLHAFFSSS